MHLQNRRPGPAGPPASTLPMLGSQLLSPARVFSGAISSG
uniref:Uncharacterized protein n=1 Tax=Arundo donax TaxID=35708 RepID=A0A0A9BZ10_ARUDO